MLTQLSTTPPKFMRPTVKSTFGNYKAADTDTEKKMQNNSCRSNWVLTALATN